MWTWMIAAALAAEPAPTDVWLVTLGAFPEDLVRDVQTAVAGLYNLRVDVVEGAIALPKAAWYEPRRRWRADVLLDWLPTQIPGPGTALGLTTSDISTTKPPFEDWGIFGLGELPGDAAVISSYRLRRGADAAKLKHRVTITAMHEVGHTLGLPHCTEVGCLMQDAEGGIENTDGATGELGPGCRALLQTR